MEMFMQDVRKLLSPCVCVCVWGHVCITECGQGKGEGRGKAKLKLAGKLMSHDRDRQRVSELVQATVGVAAMHFSLIRQAGGAVDGEGWERC